MPALPWCCGDSLSAAGYAQLQPRAIFDCCKWNNQGADRPLLCSFPLILDVTAWNQLARLASNLARETLAAERELLERADLHDALGLPRACGAAAAFPGTAATWDGPRVVRFDFHWTTGGWRISEANTDVAGGFVEASGVTQLLAACYPGHRGTGDPAGILADAVQGKIGAGGRVGLLHLTAAIEDRQTILYLAKRLEERGMPARSAPPRSAGGRAGSRPPAMGTAGHLTWSFDSSPPNGCPGCRGRRAGSNFSRTAGPRSAILAMPF